MFLLALAASVAAAISAPPVSPRCDAESPLVVLWHKDTSAAAKKAVVQALARRCFRVTEEVVGVRGQAVELADGLGVPLIAVKASAERKPTGHIVALTVDRVDVSSHELKVLAHVADTIEMKGARHDADVWKRAAAFVSGALERALDVPAAGNAAR